MKALALTVLALIGGATGAYAQFGNVTVGNDARALAMGGAGVATGGANRANPASLAFANNLRIYFPTIGLRTEGALNDVTKLENISKFVSGTEREKNEAATDLARKFATSESLLGLNSGFTVRFGTLELQANGIAQGRLVPNATLRSWAGSGGAGEAPAGSSIDLAGTALYTLPSVGMGIQIPAKLVPFAAKQKMSIGIGGRIKYLNSVYSHYNAVADGAGNFTATPTAEMGGKEYLSKKGIAADIGAMGQWDMNGASLAGGLVITNFIKPSMTFLDINGKNFDPVARTVSAGASFHKGGLTLAGDIVNLTSSPNIRVGGEQKLGPIALRAGFTTAGGTTYGLGILGVDIAFGKGQPLEVVQTLRF
jgi:hypothetical protein